MGVNPREHVITRATQAVRRYLDGDGMTPAPETGGYPKPASIYTCKVWRERRFGWLLGAKLVEQFPTALDPRDAQSLQAVLVRAAWRDKGEKAVMALYLLDAFAPDGSQVVHGYRYTSWLAWPTDGD